MTLDSLDLLPPGLELDASPVDRTVSGARVRWPVEAARVKPRERRNQFAIHAYTGSNGGGKTMAAVYDCLPALAAGRPVVSTCRILDPRTGEPHPLWVPLDDYRLIPELGFCEVIADEVTGMAGSRDSASMPSVILNELMQLRKDDVTFRWTTPNWKRADTGIREVTQAITTCVGLLPTERKMVTEDGLVRRWRPRRLFYWRTYDAQKFDEWTTAKERSSSSQHRVKPVARQLYRLPGSTLLDFYDTFEHSLTLGAVSDHGMCMDCGGSRPRKKCICDGETQSDPSLGTVAWRKIDRARRPSLYELPETDDTPGVLIESVA